MPSKNGKIEHANRDLKDLQLGLEAISLWRIPVKLGIAIAECRDEVKDHSRRVEEVRKNTAKRYQKDGEDVTPGDDEWGKFVDEVGELMDQTFTVKDPHIKLYHREHDGEDWYAFLPKYLKDDADEDGRITEAQPQVFYGLRKLLTVEEYEDAKKEGAKK